MRSSAQIFRRLPGELLARLDAEARARSLDRSDLIRELLETALSGAAADEKPWDRVSELVGRYRLGVPDLGARHREHLREILGDRR